MKHPLTLSDISTVNFLENTHDHMMRWPPPTIRRILQLIRLDQDVQLSFLALGLIVYLSLMASSKTQQFNRPLILDAGFGNTGTSSMFAATCHLRLRSVHYGKHCGFIAADKDKRDVKNLPPGLVAHERLLLAKMALNSCVAESTMQQQIHPCPSVKEALDGMLGHIDDVIASPDIDVLHDSPYHEFTDYIIEATERIRGVKPIVILSERDPREWASRRIENGKGLICRLDASKIGSESRPVNPGMNMLWCLQTAMAQNLGDVAINEVFWTVGQLSDKEEYRSSIMAGGLALYQ